MKESRNKQWVVRVVTGHAGKFDEQVEKGPLLECLQTAGVVEVQREDSTGVCFDILPPVDSESKAWSESVAAILLTMGANAVSAPRMPAKESTGSQAPDEELFTAEQLFRLVTIALPRPDAKAQSSMVKVLIRALQIHYFAESYTADAPNVKEYDEAKRLAAPK